MEKVYALVEELMVFGFMVLVEFVVSDEVYQLLKEPNDKCFVGCLVFPL